MDMNDLLAAKAADLTRLEVEIERATIHLQQLTNQRDETRAFILSHLTLSTPIRKLPMEILQEVFMYCLPPSEREFSGAPNGVESPMVLTRVCAQWRQVALATPRLWDTLLMRFPSFHVKQVSTRKLQLMEWWLERSKAVPLTLSVNVPLASGEILKDLLPLIRAHLPRCRSLRLWLPETWLSQFSLLSGVLGTPALERLEVSFSSGQGFAVQTSPMIKLNSQGIPRLRHLSLRLRGSNSVELFAASPGLQSLDLDFSLTPSECRRLLAGCPNVVSCRFRAVDGWLPGLPESGVTTLHNLEELTIQISQPIAPLLDTLCLPSLKTLHIHETLALDSDFQVWNQDSFNAFVQRSGCTLEKLLLHNVLRTEAELVACLRMSNSLVHFGVVDVHGATLCTDHTLNMLTVKAGMPVFMPKLQFFRLGATLRSADGVFADMVNSRWCGDHGVSKLLSVGVVWKPEEHKEDIRQLQPLRARGLDVPIVLL